MLSVTFSQKLPSGLKPLVLGVKKGLENPLGFYDKFIDAQTREAIDKLISRGVFKADLGEVLVLHALSGFETVILFGLGQDEGKASNAYLEAGGKLAGVLDFRKINDPFVVLEDTPDEALCGIAMGMVLRAWRFDAYKKANKVPLEQVCFWSRRAEEIEKEFTPHRHIAESVLWARGLVNQPGNQMMPAHMIQAMKELEPLGVTVSSLDKEKMTQLGMGALLGVAQGSEAQPYLGIIHWKGGDVSDTPLALVGKGVTFDTGGLSLKPSGGMEEMKADMGGSACVLGTIRALAAMKTPINAVGVVALVENMVSGNAQRPGDIVTSMLGKTIEVLNTDAEGRLILADALTYTEQTFKPSAIIDVATLTGALRHALGPEYAGIFSHDEKLVKQLQDAGEQTGEKLWQLPLCEAFKKAMESPYADLQNIAPPRYGAGSSTAAAFLESFVSDQTPWVHLDIANQDWLTTDTPLATKGGHAFGIRLLCEWILTNRVPFKAAL